MIPRLSRKLFCSHTDVRKTEKEKGAKTRTDIVMPWQKVLFFPSFFYVWSPLQKRQSLRLEGDMLLKSLVEGLDPSRRELWID